MRCMAGVGRLCHSENLSVHAFHRRCTSTWSRNLSGKQPRLRMAEAGQVDAAAVTTAPQAPTTLLSAGDYAVQYVVLRRDLWVEKGWPLGSVVAQACHATAAAISENLDDSLTKHYISPDNLGSMAKVVLEVKDEAQLRKLSAQLKESSIVHTLWIEQPENIPTCLATKPYPKSEVGQHLKKFQLCKTKLVS